MEKGENVSNHFLFISAFYCLHNQVGQGQFFSQKTDFSDQVVTVTVDAIDLPGSESPLYGLVLCGSDTLTGNIEKPIN